MSELARGYRVLLTEATAYLREVPFTGLEKRLDSLVKFSRSQSSHRLIWARVFITLPKITHLEPE